MYSSFHRQWSRCRAPDEICKLDFITRETTRCIGVGGQKQPTYLLCSASSLTPQSTVFMSQSNDFMKLEIFVDVVTDQDLINTVFDISWYKIFPLFTLSRGARSYSSVYHVILSNGVSRKIYQSNGYNILNYVYIIVLLDNDIYVGSAVCISRSRQHEKAKNITRVSHPLRFFAIRDIYKYPPRSLFLATKLLQLKLSC